jgi:hypothetical protein
MEAGGGGGEATSGFGRVLGRSVPMFFDGSEVQRKSWVRTGEGRVYLGYH